MENLQVAFSSYVIIGLTLLILAGSAAGYLANLREKSRAMRAFIAFLVLTAFAGVATILGNSLVLWGELFLPWQDFWIMAGGVALTLFAYTLSVPELSREGRLAVGGTGVLAGLALLYCLYFDQLFLFHWTPTLNESDLYYLLLPIGTLLIVFIFMRRALFFSRRDWAVAGITGEPSLLRHLLTPQGAEAKTLRNLALALSLAFLPAIQVLIRWPWPIGFFLSNLSALLAITGVTLVYFNYAPEVNSFMAKLVGVTLAAVLLIMTIIATIDVYIDSNEYAALIARIGIDPARMLAYTSSIVEQWLLVIIFASAVVLLIFPIFFRRMLVQPLLNLMVGMGQVIDGELDTAVPVTFNDEIGYLTRSFNTLTEQLKRSQARQSELFAELQDSYDALEVRVNERTEELAAFSDLTMLSGEEENEASLLQPALDRMMELSLCEALAVHLVHEGQHDLQLASWRALSAEEQVAMSRVQAPHAFEPAESNGGVNRAAKDEQGDLASSPALRLTRLPTYLGCPLIAGDEWHGWLSCYRSAGRPFASGEASLLSALARQIGVIVENYRLREVLKKNVASVERRRVGRDLHDSVTQLLYSMTLFTRSAAEALEDGDRPRLQRSIRRLGDTALQALREMRFMLFELQPPALSEEGLAPALRKRLDMVERRVGVEVDVDIEDGPPYQDQVEQQLYYIAVEALNNALKHGRGDSVALSIRQDDHTLTLAVIDNGCGFDAGQVSLGLGLHSMRQRVESLGGRLLIESSPGEGTRVQARLPLQSRQPSGPGSGS